MVRASEPASSGSDTRTAFAAPIANAVRSPDTSPFGRHRDQADLAGAGRVDELERHLHAVAVGLVEDQLALALEGVVGGIQLARLGWIGDLLDADDDVHGRSLLSRCDPTPNPPRRVRLAYGRRSLRTLLVVNSFASSVTARNTVVVHRRLSRHHDVELVETNRRGHATRFAADAARRGSTP